MIHLLTTQTYLTALIRADLYMTIWKSLLLNNYPVHFQNSFRSYSTYVLWSHCHWQLICCYYMNSCKHSTQPYLCGKTLRLIYYTELLECVNTTTLLLERYCISLGLIMVSFNSVELLWHTLWFGKTKVSMHFI